MTTLILKFARAPQLPDFGRLAGAANTLFEAWAEAKALALEAQRRYPFVIE